MEVQINRERQLGAQQSLQHSVKSVSPGPDLCPSSVFRLKEASEAHCMLWGWVWIRERWLQEPNYLFYYFYSSLWEQIWVHALLSQGELWSKQKYWVVGKWWKRSFNYCNRCDFYSIYRLAGVWRERCGLKENSKDEATPLFLTSVCLLTLIPSKTPCFLFFFSE